MDTVAASRGSRRLEEVWRLWVDLRSQYRASWSRIRSLNARFEGTKISWLFSIRTVPAIRNDEIARNAMSRSLLRD